MRYVFFILQRLKKIRYLIGTEIRCYGEIQRGPQGFQIVHPEYKALDQDTQLTPVDETLTPVYPTTDGLRQATLRSLTEQALKRLQRGQVQELIPEQLLNENYTLAQALTLIHRPPPETLVTDLEEGKHPAQRRLIREEFMAHNVSMLKLRQSSDKHQSVSLTLKASPKPTLRMTILSTITFFTN